MCSWSDFHIGLGFLGVGHGDPAQVFLTEFVIHFVFRSKEFLGQADVALNEAGFGAVVVGRGDDELPNGFDPTFEEMDGPGEDAFGNFQTRAVTEVGCVTMLVARGDVKLPDLFNFEPAEYDRSRKSAFRHF